MNKREIKRGDIVKTREEWLDHGEDGSITYVVLEDRWNGRVLVQALGTGLTLAPTYVYDVAWLHYADRETLVRRIMQNITSWLKIHNANIPKRLRT